MDTKFQRGLKAHIAKALDLSPSFTGRLLCDQKNLSPETARKVVERIGGPLDIWLFSGNLQARRAAVEAYAARVGESVERAFKSKARYKGSGL